MADITNVFKATIKTIKIRNKKMGETSGPDKSILPTKRHKSEFTIRTIDVINNITKLKDFLLEHRREYLNTGGNLGVDESNMTNAQRDQIDADAQHFMRTCSEAIRAIETELSSSDAGHVREHRVLACTFMKAYLKDVCKVYSEQRAIRVKRVVDKKRIGRLESDNRHHKHTEGKTNQAGKDKNDLEVKSVTTLITEKENGVLPNGGDHPELDLSLWRSEADPEDEEMSAEDAQMFETENAQLYEEMNSLVNEVKNIEGKVVEISRLQEIFADKVLEQDVDIDRIADTVVATTENIKDANEEIREAMKNNAGLRVWILFFLIVCSFSLLFLDWYNP